jgi:hypothetical protein
MRIALFSLIEWDFVNQRPQAFARELAALGHEILYVEPPSVADSLEAWQARIEKGDIHTYQVEKNITICDGMLMPLRDARQYQMNESLHARVATFLKLQNIDFSIVLSPEYVDSLLQLGRPFAYDHVDETQFMDGMDTAAYVEAMDRLKAAAAFNIYIQEPAALADPKGLFVPNGTEADVFFPLERPKLFDAVILSTFAKWFDMDAVLASNSRILLIGPMDADLGNNKERYFKANKPNLQWIPQIDKQTANTWLATAEVGVVPFKLTHPVVPYAMPIKIMEYMLAGLKVVSHRTEGIEHFYRDRICYFGEGTAHATLDEAIAAAKKLPPQRDFALQFDWKHVVGALNEKIIASTHENVAMMSTPSIPQERPAVAVASNAEANGSAEVEGFKKQILRLQDQLRHRTQWAASLALECENRLQWALGLEKWARELEPQALAKIELERRLQRIEAALKVLPDSWWLRLAPADLKQALKEAQREAHALGASTHGDLTSPAVDAVHAKST